MNRFDFLHSQSNFERRALYIRRAVATTATSLTAFLTLVAVAFFHQDRHHVTQAHRAQVHLPVKKPVASRASRSERAVAVKPIVPPRTTPRPSRVTTISLRRQAGSQLLAVAVGGQPQAIIAAGVETRIVTIGDVVDGRRIEAIGLDGLRLAGTRQTMRIHR